MSPDKLGLVFPREKSPVLLSNWSAKKKLRSHTYLPATLDDALTSRALGYYSTLPKRCRKDWEVFI